MDSQRPKRHIKKLSRYSQSPPSVPLKSQKPAIPEARRPQQRPLQAIPVCCGVAPEGSVVTGLARGTVYKGAALPRVSTFLLFVLDILSGNRRIELSSCSAPTQLN
jgi:hypothetical protein